MVGLIESGREILEMLVLSKVFLKKAGKILGDPGEVVVSEGGH